MTVVPFIRRAEALSPAGPWTGEELAELQRLVRRLSRWRGARTWYAAATEAGDPQFYVLGADPEQRCVASVSRLRGFYVLEDGEGRVLAERDTLADLVRSAGALFRSRRRFGVTARVFLALCAARSFLNEKMAAVEESLEVLAVLV